MRGARSRTPASPSHRRIIPADAGSTEIDIAGSSCRMDHPRRCGEHKGNVRQSLENMGSSPQMRGARHGLTHILAGEGIIPADAGSTHNCQSRRVETQDHPRRCGEHQVEHIAAVAQLGSSPQMRGAPGRPARLCPARRIIPADAGSTSLRYRWTVILMDHPRRCGEHSILADCRSLSPGSSPQMRGARIACQIGDSLIGIIPADAGSTMLKCGI